MEASEVLAAEELARLANRAVADLKDKIRNRKNAAERAIDAEFAPDLEAAQKLMAEAERTLKLAMDAAAKPHPYEGQKVFLVRLVYDRYTRRKIGEKRTEGVIETIRSDSPMPLNKRWDRPTVGEVIVRKLKKDGSPALDWHARRVRGSSEPAESMGQWKLVSSTEGA